MVRRPIITVLAGINGAGKSSVFGPLLKEYGIFTWYNPDQYASMLAEELPSSEANGLAWRFGFESLKAKVKAGENFAVETTLGGRTYTDELIKATETHDVNVLYCGLSPQICIYRVLPLGSEPVGMIFRQKKFVKDGLILLKI